MDFFPHFSSLYILKKYTSLTLAIIMLVWISVNQSHPAGEFLSSFKKLQFLTSIWIIWISQKIIWVEFDHHILKCTSLSLIFWSQNRLRSTSENFSSDIYYKNLVLKSDLQILEGIWEKILIPEGQAYTKLIHKTFFFLISLLWEYLWWS